MRILFWICMALLVAPVHGQEIPARDEAVFMEAFSGLGAKSRKTIKESVQELARLGDVRAVPALEALLDKRLRVAEDGTLYILVDDGGAIHDALTGEPAGVSEKDLKRPRITNAIRRVLRPAIGLLSLGALDPETRLRAAEALRKRPSDAMAEPLHLALAKETDLAVREVLALALAQIDLASNDRQRRLQAIGVMGESGNLVFHSLLQPLLEKGSDGSFAEPDADIRAAADAALRAIDRKQLFVTQTANLFYGVSLGSILLLAALGLAITFGLMGVINMAHGEMLMLGAYSTFLVQNLFKSYLPGLFDWYLLAAIPIAFLVSAVVGMVIERSVIRYLYGRPLETLLATWGISLLLIQSVRLLFGAQNVEVANPSWLAGGYSLFEGVVLPYNRLAIILFVVFVLLLVWAILQRTRLGLQVRAVTQGRPMAAAMGIPTARVDMWTFGLGSGVAGLGGVALSQVGNVGPELGQLYIVDSFMVVVLGGVGKLVGTVVGALGLGVVHKFLEPVSGAVLAKILVLVFIILFIQKRPQGIFALKGRLAEG